MPFVLLRHVSSVSLGVLLSFCQDIVPIVATFLLLFALSFFMTNFLLSRHFTVPALAKSVAFLTIFSYFCSKHLQNTNLGED